MRDKAAIFEGNKRFCDVFVLEQHTLNNAGVNPMTANLEFPVKPSCDDQPAVIQQISLVAGPVVPPTEPFDEPCTRECIIIEVASRKSLAANPYFPRLADRAMPAVRVSNHNPRT